MPPDAIGVRAVFLAIAFKLCAKAFPTAMERGFSNAMNEISGEHHHLTLAYPRDADVASHRVSVLAPVGSALLGLSVGQAIDWQAPGGRALRLRVTEVVAAPESASVLHR